MNILDEYVIKYPEHQTAVDMFKGEWSSLLPGGQVVSGGGIPLYHDTRMTWADTAIGGFKGKNVLELGPLEAAHSYMMAQFGAKNILAIEANSRAFFKCLIAKNMYELNNCQFLLGDFNEYMQKNDAQFDVVLACGVMYHMKDPLEFLHLVSKTAKQLVVWTHYYDKDLIGAQGLLGRFPEQSTKSAYGVECTYHKHMYGEALSLKGFCGGYEHYSNWIPRADIFKALEAFGMQNFQIAFDQPDHPHGPALIFTCERP